MVMETPSPQCVGREFVRQYYTLLHEAPLHLHRFYSNNSSFVHGGVEKPGEEQPPVMGQADIHKKIMSLNFRDCHAKIRQVDSQATVGSGVVVQVTGELSNNGQPMRRFMQTFVLAPQTPKKYYVHNDIFRYQDEVFHDNDTDAEHLEDAVGEEFSDSEPETLDVGLPPEQLQEPPTFYDHEPAPTLSNGTAHLEERIDSPDHKSVDEEEEEKEAEITPEPEQPFDMGKDEVEEIMEEEPKHEEPEPEMEPPAKSAPFSWAALASKNTVGAPNTMPVQTPMAPPVMKPAPAMGRPDPKTDSGPATITQGAQPQRGPRIPRDRMRDRGERNSLSRGEGDADMDMQSNRRGSRIPDSHQLFVGNLPHMISEKELKSFFEHWGHVLELRINTKSGGGKLPNFGFVVFDSPEPVQKILSVKPIKYNGEHRLNVEEKKPRGDGNRPGSGNRGIGGRGGMGGGPGGRGGMGGMGRGIRPPGGGMGPSGPRPERAGSLGPGPVPRGGMAGPRR